MTHIPPSAVMMVVVVVVGRAGPLRRILSLHEPALFRSSLGVRGLQPLQCVGDGLQQISVAVGERDGPGDDIGGVRRRRPTGERCGGDEG